ncbi:MAG: SDR family NAD(P)-dependent oxidoreductase [Vallitalea sp.]|jgi:polyketide synthase PksN|nr:SDR family NAD(P)-dependent oxidoreductase [Vallitalea sp.]
MGNLLNRKDVLEMIVNKEVSVEDGFVMLNNLPKETDEDDIPSIEYYQYQWCPIIDRTFEYEGKGNMVLFDVDDSMYYDLKKQTSQEDKIILIKPGVEYRIIEDTIIEINPNNYNDYTKLIKYIEGYLGGYPSTICHAWTREAFSSTSVSLDKKLEKSFYSIFYLSKSILENNISKDINMLYIYPSLPEEDEPLYEAVGAFARTLGYENPHFKMKVIRLDIANTKDYREIACKVITKDYSNESSIIYKYDGKQYYERKLEDCKIDGTIASSEEEEGCVVITGGTGGLGLKLAQYIRNKSELPIVLTGRRSYDALPISARKIIDNIDNCEYRPCDVTCKEDVEGLIKYIRANRGKVISLYHSAGILKDKFIVRKEIEDIQMVMGPKVWGSVYLWEALQDDPPREIVLFSSLAGVMGNLGQCDYAYSNSFMDCFARSLSNKGHKIVSINWPLWDDGGMNLTGKDREIYKKQSGMEPLPTTLGFRVMDKLISNQYPQCFVSYGIHHIVKDFVNGYTDNKIDNSKKINTEISQDDTNKLLKKTETFLIDIFSRLLKVDTNNIDIGTSFEEYGVDSLLINEFNSIIGDYFKKLPKTILFENRNIYELTHFLVENYEEEILNLFNNSVVEKVEEQPLFQQLTPLNSSNEGLYKRQHYKLEENSSNCKDVAIIGLSGVYPGAKSIDDYWNNLAGGINTVKEIPIERWDYRKFYHEDYTHVKAGKSYCKWGGFIDDAYKFDAEFFNISPREAEVMDPQERLFLQTAWWVFEDAGYTKEEIDAYAQERNTNDVGVFVGVTTNTYRHHEIEEAVKDNYILANSAEWSIANRVSYSMDFNGPSMAIDTACSSSITAIHLACESLLRKESALAVAGGVNLYLHPSKYIELCQAKMLSPTGQCHAFSIDSDGFVPGEGVGAILLKPLEDAVRDHDHIYGVIKGSHINHGGKTNGYTVPNPALQADLIKGAIERSGLEAHTISYIEAHGTGTRLGDPIEITGLTKAFSQYTDDKQFCAIGSSKSNIGHLEAAAGIGGITKILLQFKHKKLVPSLFTDKLNPNINFEDTPFYVQRKLEDWTSPYPRRAGISSFGAGGANGHIIVEEYTNPTLREIKPTEEVIVFSAKTSERLTVYLTNMFDFLEANSSLISLQNIAYTLQTGRKAQEERIAFVVSSVEELLNKIQAYISDEDVKDVYKGYVDYPERIQYREINEDMKRNINEAIERRQLSQLANLWVMGNIIEWKKLYNELPYRISLPLYPFQKERYFIDKVLPHLWFDSYHYEEDTNTYKFTKQFYGSEFYIEDHNQVLPAAAYLEMVRGMTQEVADNKKVIGFREVCFLQPLIVPKAPITVNVNIKITGEKAHFEVFSIDGQNIKKNASGKIHLSDKIEAKKEYMDIEAMKGYMKGGKAVADTYYDTIEALGAIAGKRLKGLVEFYYSDSEGLGVVDIHEDINETKNQYILHPTLIDGGIRTADALGFIMYPHVGSLHIPYTLESMEIVDSNLDIRYVHIKANKDNDATRHTDSWDITFLDKRGKVLACMNNFYTTKVDLTINNNQVVYGTSIWKPMELVEDDNKSLRNETILILTSNDLDIASQRFKFHLSNKVVYVKSGESFNKVDDYHYEIRIDNPSEYEELIKQMKMDNLIPNFIIHNFSKETFIDNKESIDKGMTESFYSCLYLYQASLREKKNKQCNMLYLYENGEEYPNPVYEAVSGMMKTAILENPHYHVKTVGISSYTIQPTNKMLEIIEREMLENDTLEVLYDNSRKVKVIQQLEIERSKETPYIKQSGVYLITGGMGGLGLIFAKHLVKQYDAHVVLTGRSPIDRDGYDKLDKHIGNSKRVVYLQSDITKEEDVKKVIEYIGNHYGKLDGVIHSAGLIRDAKLINKRKETVDTIIAPKVIGTYFLVQELRKLSPDFVCFFSSLCAVGGNIGQGDYAYGNAFMDSYTKYLNSNSTTKYISINWPLWQDGGMQVEDGVKKLFEDMVGLIPLQSSVGINAFENILGQSINNVFVIEGNEQKITSSMNIQSVNSFHDIAKDKEALTEQSPVSTKENRELVIEPKAIENLSIEEYFSEDFKKIISSILKLPVSKINRKKFISQFGFDSILFSELAMKVNEQFNLDITPAIFFGHETLGDLEDYLLKEYDKSLQDYYSRQLMKVEETKGFNDELVQEEQIYNEDINECTITNEHNRDLEPVAIIGISGMMPQSDNLEMFYENLIEGKDLISEIPIDRWDYKAYYGEPTVGEKKTKVKWAGFMNNIDTFDPLFFNISPKDAELMDPQERLMLQTIWHTIEDAGYSSKDISGTNTDVYIGISNADYKELMIEASKSTPMTHSVEINRISFLLNLKGRSEPIDTACSSSLVAISKAVESIQSGTCNMAIAGGVNVIACPNLMILQSMSGMLSEDGHCKTFDKSANGYVRGEGVGAILLKSLSQAEKDGDHIYGLIRSTSINHGGRSSSMTAPNMMAQKSLLVDVYKKANIDPAYVSYIEAHGTGTSLGDPIEIDALKKAFGELYELHNKDIKNNYCAIGAVKTNIGHLESASGIASVLKVLLCMKHKKIPGILHLKEQNPLIDLEGTPFYLEDKTTNWERLIVDEKEVPRIAGVSSFGIGGVNSHIVIEEYIEKQHYESNKTNDNQLYILSAKNNEALHDYIKDFIKHIEKLQPQGEDFHKTREEIAYTLQVGRDQHNVRLAIMSNTLKQLASRLERYVRGEKDIEDIFYGTVEDININRLQINDDIRLMSDEQLENIAISWVQGADIDFGKLYNNKLYHIPHRRALPVYPFRMERYWFSHDEEQHTRLNTHIERIHPLVTKNISNLFQQKYTTRLTGEEYFIKEHTLGEIGIVPGAVLLGIMEATSSLSLNELIYCITNVAFVEPVEFRGTAFDVFTALTPKENIIECEIYSGESDKKVYSVGDIHMLRQEDNNNYLDIKSVLEKCKEQFNCESLYKGVNGLGLSLGKSFNSIISMHTNSRESLAYIELPEHLYEDKQQYRLHPVLIDGALQSIIGTLSSEDLEKSLFLPFLIEEVIIYNTLPEKIYAHTEFVKQSKDIMTFNITITDIEGRILVKLNKYAVKKYNNTSDNK